MRPVQPVVLPDLLKTASHAQWSLQIRDTRSGTTIVSHEPGRSLKTASVGKLFLLTELACRIDAGLVDPLELLNRNIVPPIRDSGLWCQLAVERLPIGDIATLVGAVSDNWATNVLIETLGLDAVQERARSLGYIETQLHDYVRDERGADYPATLSTGCAGDLCDFFVRLARAELVSPPVSKHVRHWLSASVDLSMLAAAFGLDPLINGADHGAISFLNKTGSDVGVRVDTGLIEGATSYAYAAIANWDGNEALTRSVLSDMRALGELLAD